MDVTLTVAIVLYRIAKRKRESNDEERTNAQDRSIIATWLFSFVLPISIYNVDMQVQADERFLHVVQR